jgi:hypothetical protein
LNLQNSPSLIVYKAMKTSRGLQSGNPSHFFSNVSGICITLILIIGFAASAQTTIPPEQWSAMQVVAGSQAYPTLYYPFTGSATQPLSVTCQFQPSSYSPGSYEAGYVSPGWISLDMDVDGWVMDGTAILEIDKYYSYPWSQAYTEVLLGNDGRGINLGTYAPGGLYTVIFTFNRAASTIQIDVTGPTSCSRTVSSNGRDIVRLTFHGLQRCNCGLDSLPSLFGNVSVTVPTPPVPPALVLGGMQTVNGTNIASLTWTNNGVACVLESSAALSGGWSTVSTPFVTNGNWLSIQVTNTSSVQFFHLRSP